MFKILKLKIKQYVDIVSKAMTIQNQEDYEKARAWLKKASTVCGICAVIGLAYGLFAGIFVMNNVMDVGILSIPIGLLLGEWSLWGVAAFLLNIREIFNIKKMVKLGKMGYEVGKEIKETHVDVTHEFGNRYTVKATTEDKGCLFAFIAIFIRFILWMYFSVLVGAFLIVKKLVSTAQNIKAYQEK